MVFILMMSSFTIKSHFFYRTQFFPLYENHQICVPYTTSVFRLSFTKLNNMADMNYCSFLLDSAAFNALLAMIFTPNIVIDFHTPNSFVSHTHTELLFSELTDLYTVAECGFSTRRTLRKIQ